MDKKFIIYFCKVPCGMGRLPNSKKTEYVDTKYQNSLMVEMIQSQSNLDICLVGPKGCGKSITVEKLAEMLNYQIEPIVLYQASIVYCGKIFRTQVSLITKTSMTLEYK